MARWVLVLASAGACTPAFDEDGCPNEDHPGVIIIDDPRLSASCPEEGDWVPIALHFWQCPNGCIEERLLKRAP
jgi:hypothetical protein